MAVAWQGKVSVSVSHRAVSSQDSTIDVQELNRQITDVGIGALLCLLVPLVLIGFELKFGFWQTAVLTALALFFLGVFIGFLFGVPKVAAAQSSHNDDSADTGQGRRHRVIDVNTNLEQISDWLTKIIVGLGLVELKQLPDAAVRFVAFISPAFHETTSSSPMAVGSTLYFPVVGFLSGYLLTRLYIASLIARVDARVGETVTQTQVAVTALVAAAVASAPNPPSGSSTAADANYVRQAVTPTSIAKFSQAAILWVDDVPQGNDYLIKAFRELGITVDLSLSTEDAVAKLDSGRQYSAIITDMGRPSDPRAGYTLLAELRKRNLRVPVIVYASSDSEEHRKEAQAAGAVDSTNRPQRVFQFVTDAIRRGK